MEVVIARDVNCFRSAGYDVLTAVNFAHGKLVKTDFLSSTAERMIERQRAHGGGPTLYIGEHYRCHSLALLMARLLGQDVLHFARSFLQEASIFILHNTFVIAACTLYLY